MCPTLPAPTAVGKNRVVGGPHRARPDCTPGSKCRTLLARRPEETGLPHREDPMNRRVPRGTLLAATLALLPTTAPAEQQDTPAQAPAPAATPAPAPAAAPA